MNIFNIYIMRVLTLSILTHFVPSAFVYARTELVFTKVSSDLYSVSNIFDYCNNLPDCKIVGPEGIRIELKAVGGQTISVSQAFRSRVKLSSNYTIFSAYFLAATDEVNKKKLPIYSDASSVRAVNGEGLNYFNHADDLRCEECNTLVSYFESNRDASGVSGKYVKVTFTAEYYRAISQIGELNNIVFDTESFAIDALYISVPRNTTIDKISPRAISTAQFRNYFTKYKLLIDSLEGGLKKSDRNYLARLKKSVSNIVDLLSEKNDGIAVSILDDQVREYARQVTVFTIVLDGLLQDYADSNIKSIQKQIEQMQQVPGVLRGLYGWRYDIAGGGSKAISPVADVIARLIKDLGMRLIESGADSNITTSFSMINQAAIKLRIKVDTTSDVAADQEIVHLFRMINNPSAIAAMVRLESPEVVNGEVHNKLEMLRMMYESIENQTHKSISDYPFSKSMVLVVKNVNKKVVSK